MIINPMATVLYYTSYLTGQYAGILHVTMMIISNKTREIHVSVIFPSEYLSYTPRKQG